MTVTAQSNDDETIVLLFHYELTVNLLWYMVSSAVR